MWSNHRAKAGLDRVQRIAGGHVLELREQRAGVDLDRMSDGRLLRLRGRMKPLLGEICNEVPATRTTAVNGEREGPSADKRPAAPSFPMTAVATVCPFGMSMMNAIVPLSGK